LSLQTRDIETTLALFSVLEYLLLVRNDIGVNKHESQSNTINP